MCHSKCLFPTCCGVCFISAEELHKAVASDGKCSFTALPPAIMADSPRSPMITFLHVSVLRQSPI